MACCGAAAPWSQDVFSLFLCPSIFPYLLFLIIISILISYLLLHARSSHPFSLLLTTPFQEGVIIPRPWQGSLSWETGVTTLLHPKHSVGRAAVIGLDRRFRIQNCERKGSGDDQGSDMCISISLLRHLSNCDPARSWKDPQANYFALCGNYKKNLLLQESHGDSPWPPFLNHSPFKGEQVS